MRKKLPLDAPVKLSLDIYFPEGRILIEKSVGVAFAKKIMQLVLRDEEER